MMTPMKRMYVALLCMLIGALPVLRAADKPGVAQKDASSVLNTLRLKKLTKDLELTEDQQKKIMALFEEEAKVTAQYREDNKMSFLERNAKIKEAQEVTYTKMKPLLTPAQAEKFDKLRAEAAKPKKKK